MIKKIFGFYTLPLRILVRPVDSFYAMKFEEKGTVRLALFNFFLVMLSFAFSNQFTSILVDERHPLMVNSVTDALFMLATLLLFCTANWSVTALTDGEGKFKDIVMAVCYAMTPLVLTIIPATIISNFLSMDETGLYYLLLSAGVAYFVLLTFVGLLTIHNFGAVKMLVTLLLTVVAILVIVFLLALAFTLWQQLFGFAYSLYTEIIFRI